MSGATHTPGPWEVIADAGHPANGRITSKARPHIAKVYAVGMEPDAEAMANAALIAAAPDMLQAAERVLKWVEPIAGDNRDEAAATEEIESVAELRAAISRARLEQKDATP